MHAFSILTIGIFVAGYSTARWDLVTRLYELTIFAWDHGVVARAAKGFALLSALFLLFILPIVRIAAQETDLVSEPYQVDEAATDWRNSIPGLLAPASLRASSSNVAVPSSGVAG
jgi:hypothetical protein